MNLELRSLKTVPLLEGEEGVKFLNLQGNQISVLQNIVSLPNLSFLNLGANQIKSLASMGNFEQSLSNLKVLIMCKNKLQTEGLSATDPALKSPFSYLPCLDLLDLHQNQFSGAFDFAKLGFGGLSKLRIMNLSFNKIEQVVLNCSLPSLCELNLRNNEINSFAVEAPLDCLQKLYLQNNKISTLQSIKSGCLPKLKDL